jgi:hypothetical protein
MRALVVIGVVLVLFSICALVFGGVTYFTTKRALDAGPFHVDVQKPHTIVFNPIVGIVASATGAVMIVAGITKNWMHAGRIVAMTDLLLLPMSAGPITMTPSAATVAADKCARRHRDEDCIADTGRAYRRRCGHREG